MKEISEFIKRIDKEHYHHSKRETFPLDTFYQKIYYSGSILDALYSHLKRRKKGPKKNNLLKEARKNFVINCATATEVYFKDLVSVTPELSKNIRESEAVKELLVSKGRVNLWDAYQIFKEKEYRIGDILVYYYSFQNIGDINTVMSKLLKVDNFFNKVETYTVELDDDSSEWFGLSELILVKHFPKWKTLLSELFSLRHDYVHQINFKDKLGDAKLRRYYNSLTAFITAADSYFFDKVEMDEK